MTNDDISYGMRESIQPSPPRLVVAISGASGAIYGVRALELLRAAGGVETHLVCSRAGSATIKEETGRTVGEVEALADVVHRTTNIGDTIASGSYATAGMLIAPCSIKTLSAVANCYADDLISRAADVHLKEGRPLVLMVRETPFHVGHLRLMTAAAEAGAIIAPPVPAFYNHPETVDDIVDHTVVRILHRLGVDVGPRREWAGLGQSRKSAPTEPQVGLGV
jgi:4-hydroxy-3-polyprenylbenzoate decarboxylase